MPLARHSEPTDEANERTSRQGVTFRSIVIGLVCVAVVCWACLYSNMIQKSSYLAGTLMSVGVIFVFLVVVLGLNTLLKLIKPRFGLSRAELVVIFIMTLLATFVPTFGWGELFFPQVTAFKYYASPANKWGRTLLPHLEKAPVSIIPTEDNKAIQHFYQGLPSDKASPGDIPWRDWIGPLAWWFSFFLPLFFLLLCVAVVMRKQWVERERLVFPLLQVPMEIIQVEDRRSVINAFFRNPVMWCGFLFPVVFDIFKSLHFYFDFIPAYRFIFGVKEIFGFYSVRFHPNWVMAGFTYLISLDVSFSIWFFSWAKEFAGGLLNWLGWSLGKREYYSAREPAIMHFCIGAILALVAFQLWAARSHLKDVFRKAVLGARDVDDSGETMSYRLAVFGALICTVWIWIWLCMIGMQWWLPPLFLGLSLAIFLAITRVVIEGGVPTATASFIPQSAIPNLLGTSALTHQSLIAMGLSFAWISDIRVILLPFFAHCVRLADSVKMKRRKLPWIMMATMLVALVVTTITIFWLCYEAGGINLNSWFFVGGAQWAPKYAHRFITEPVTAAKSHLAARWACTAAGGGFVAFLTFMRYTFVWWPLHPLGLPFSIPSWPIVMIVWLLKALFLKYGGIRLYRRFKPFFLGLILGQFASAGCWFVIDIGFDVVGHVLYNR